MAVRSLLKTILAVTTLCLSLNASANLIFNFGAGSDTEHSVGYELGDYLLTVSAFNPNGTDGLVHRNSSGLGVGTNPNRGRLGANRNGYESLLFTLTNGGLPANFWGSINIVFSAWQNADRARVDGSGVQNATYKGNAGVYTTAFSGNTFEVKGRRAGDGIRVAQVTFVPEPGTLAILSIGLLGLGARRFKKS
jgi:hypothetical protein